MAGSTDHYGLQQLEGGESFSSNGYKYTNDDRQTIDNLLYLGAEGHIHNGTAGSITEPDSPLNLVQQSTGGTIPGGTRVYYKYTLVNERSEESAPSPEAYIDTPAQVLDPASASLTYATTGGTLQGGNYYYVLSGYVGASTNESKAVNPTFITVPITSAANVITLTLPDVGTADGFNVYRRKPGQTKYFWLDQIDMTVATPPSIYEDDGSVSEDCDRTLPRINTTHSANSIDISAPGATPIVPSGYTWKIYRTYVQGNWENSLLAWVVENISELSTEITPTYTDVGASTTAGTYPESSLVVGSPSKILLTNMAEVQGTLPMAASAFPFAVTFAYPGPLTATTGDAVWRCPFPVAEIISCSATLGVGSTPASTPVIVDVNLYHATAATPTRSTIYTTQANRPRVNVGAQWGAITCPDVNRIYRDEQLSIDLDQVGGGATPTDENLVLTISLIVHGYPSTSYTYSAVVGQNSGLGF